MNNLFRGILLILIIPLFSNESGRTWVYFKDKGLSISEESHTTLLQSFPKANIERRAKLDKSRVKFEDFPVYRTYMDELENTGAEILGHSRWLNAVVIADEDIPLLRQLAFIEKMTRVRLFRRDLPEVEPSPLHRDASFDLAYGISLPQLATLGVPEVHRMGFNGEGVFCCFMDTGFRTSHQAFSGVDIIGTYDFVSDDSIVSYQDGDPSNIESHGTACWSVASGAFPGTHYGPAFGASYLLARTEDVSGETMIEEDYWVMGIEWAESLGVSIVSTSLGYNDWYTAEDMNGDSAVTTIAADYAASVGILVVNAAGNSGSAPSTIAAPADADSILSVGAVNSTGDIAGFSSRGPTADGRIKPELCALGMSTRCATHYGDTEFGSKSGTSLSAPLISGIAILLLQVYPHLGPMEAIDILKSTATNRLTPNNDYGWGIPNINYAIRTDGDSLGLFPLKHGWNLVSNPFQEPMPITSEYFPGIVSTAWAFDPATRAYEAITELDAGRGCFLPYSVDTVIFMQGDIASSVSIDVQAGWNIIGCRGSIADSTEYTCSPESALLPSEVYKYNTETGAYIRDKILVPGEARWFLILEDATFTIE